MNTPKPRAATRQSQARRIALLTLFYGAAACSGPAPAIAAGDAVAEDTAAADAPSNALVGDDAAGDVGTDQDQGDAALSWPLPPPSTVGGKRPAAVRVPKDYAAKSPRPVVILLGGYDYLAQDLDDWLRVTERVDTDGFVLVLPDGLIDSDGSPFWNATDSCCDWDDTGVDDVGYLLGLLDELATKVRIDPKRVALLGHSAGGFMAYRLACEAPHRFSAVVSIAGSGHLDPTVCQAKLPVSLLQVHGQLDDVMPIDGDEDAPSARTMLTRWGQRAGCTPSSWGADAVKLEHADDGVADETEVFRYTAGCAPGIDVRFWRMAGNGHYPEFRPVFTAKSLAWALAQQRL